MLETIIVFFLTWLFTHYFFVKRPAQKEREAEARIAAEVNPAFQEMLDRNIKEMERLIGK